MKQNKLNQWPITKIEQEINDSLVDWINAFIFDRRSQYLSSGTIYFYQKKLKLFATFCESQVLTGIFQLTPPIIREYLLWLEQTGHNQGGVFCCYRVLKTFLFWWETEVEPEGWKNPIRKVKKPKTAIEPLEPVSFEIIQALLNVCNKKSFHGSRDYSIILFLLDTGCRAAELCSVNFNNYNQITGEVLIERGKGSKPRQAYLGKIARRSMHNYLKKRPDCKALFTTQTGERLSYWGLNEIIKRLSTLAGVEKPGLHDFRRAFALSMLRNGTDLISLQALMGHADLQVLTRYIKQTGDDLKKAHEKGSPVDYGL